MEFSGTCGKACDVPEVVWSTVVVFHSPVGWHDVRLNQPDSKLTNHDLVENGKRDYCLTCQRRTTNVLVGWCQGGYENIGIPWKDAQVQNDGLSSGWPKFTFCWDLYELFVTSGREFVQNVPVLPKSLALQVGISQSLITAVHHIKCCRFVIDTVASRTLELCLTEASKCHLFVGILGDRYGWVPSKDDIPSGPEFDWVRDYSPGASVTELEIHLAALAKPTDALEKAFVYFRSSQFLRFADLALCCWSFYASTGYSQRSLQ